MYKRQEFKTTAIPLKEIIILRILFGPIIILRQSLRVVLLLEDLPEPSLVKDMEQEPLLALYLTLLSWPFLLKKVELLLSPIRGTT